MNCQKCGAPVEEGSKFCEVCGAPVENIPQVISRKEAAARQLYEDYGSYNVNQEFDTKKIRRWFINGDSNLKWIILIVIGLITLLMVVGIPILIIGIVGLVISGSASRNEVDNAWNTYVKVLSERGFSKLNIIEEQVNLADPVVLVGLGASPDSSFEAAKEMTAKRSLFSILLSAILRILPFKRKVKGTELDPYEAIRIGKDDILRSMLMSVSVYRFSEEQLLIYTGNIDISTGLIYNERTEEVFYKDIEGIRFVQSIFKVYSNAKKCFVNKTKESMELYLSGCTIHANYRTDMNVSAIQEPFNAMRNLIRDKKNS